jgi:hypothetical protein
VTNILKNGMDRQQSLLGAQSGPANLPVHENIRGPDYFH